MESDPAAVARAPRRIFGVGAIMLGLFAVLWFGGATFVAHRLKYPGFLATGRGDVYGAHVPKEAPSGDPRISFGAEFETVTIANAAGGIAGWFIPAGPSAAAVLIVPPAGATRAAMLPYAKFLHAAGFSVLTIDSGDTAQSGTDWGVAESSRVLAAADSLKLRGFARIAALGVSEGAAAAIFAQAKRPVFAAIVSDSSYASLGAMFQRAPSIEGLNPAFTMTVMAEARLWLGHDPYRVAPVQAAARLGGAALMVIQNRGDPIAPESDGRAIAEAAGASAELWIAPSDGHGDAIFEAPEEYARRVMAFLGRALKK